jgi:hypothetical protein
MKTVEKSKIHLGEKDSPRISAEWAYQMRMNIPGFGDGNRICREGCQGAEVKQERTAEEIRCWYYRKPPEEAWDEVPFVSKRDN